jgi:SpoVK/Ycf46/Vps4 family AAA+-type ATPase
MGEKLLAQRLLALLRNDYGRCSREASVLMDWLLEQRDWLWPERSWTDAPAPGLLGRVTATALSWDTLPALVAEISTAEPSTGLEECLERVATLLDLTRFERELLSATALLERLPRLSNLRMRLLGAGADLTLLVGRLAGAAPAEAAARVRRSLPLSLGLLYLGSDGCGGIELAVQWRFGRVLDAGLTDEGKLISSLAGVPQQATLDAGDFAEQADALRLLTRLLESAVRRRARGVNVLIYGPPGTGKTEFARTLAAGAGAPLYAVGEADLDGDEPSRCERLQALMRAQHVLARRGGSILLFDEMEDLFSEASIAASGARRAGSKIFVNRMLEEGRVPVIWTSNDVDAVDPAHLRRMTFVLRMDYPSARARARIVARAAEAEQAEGAAEGLAPLLTEPETATIARAALRAAAIVGGGAEEANAVGNSLILGLRGGRSLAPKPFGGGLDLGLYEADQPIGPLIGRLAAPGVESDFSLLLTGPPGTGKTALAAYLAERLDRPLQVKRTSDLLSKWVGETEANIAAAFAQARDEGAVLLFDEADSLLLDRADAQRSWEITQVNELLTWMDNHPLPFVAATNFAQRLDPAALRRFVFKIELKPLSANAAGNAFERFFGRPAPDELAELGGLTPGDFAVVKRQLRYRPEAEAAEIVALLAAEARSKPERPVKIGF